MKRPNTTTHKSPPSARVGAARTRKEAAIQLVRLEFDMSRLQRAIDQAERRASVDREAFREKALQRRSLMKLLNG